MKTLFFLSALFLISLSSCSHKVAPAKSDDRPVTYHIVDKIGKSDVKAEEKAKVKEAKKAMPFFKITGLERYWELEMSTEALNFISANDGESITVPYTKPVHVADANVKLYRSKSKGNEIEITIMEAKCPDEATDLKNSLIVKVSVKRAGETEFTTLKGCGQYLPDNRLNVVWILRQIKQQKMAATDFGNELPYMDLHTGISQFTGFAGCNRMKGRLVFSESNELQFKEVVTTKMMCQGNNREVSFLNALQACTRYEILDNALYLYQGKDLQLVFSKS